MGKILSEREIEPFYPTSVKDKSDISLLTGRLRRSYLQEHRPGLYSRLVLSEKLFPHLREIDETANRRLEQMMPELMKSAGVTEELKARDQMKWVGLMNSLKAQAEEIILSELVYN